MTSLAAERWRVLDRFCDHLAPNLPADTTISTTAPADGDTRPRMVWVVKVDGDVTVPAFTGSRLPRDDQWEARFTVRAMGLGHDLTVLRDTHSTMVDAFDDLCADDSTLTDDDSLVSVEMTRVEDHAVLDGGPNGLIAVATVVVAFHTRLI